MKIAFVGGTGPAGIGLGARLGRAGHDVFLGSRSVDNAERACRRVSDMAPDATVECGLNDEIIPGADVVILAVRDRVQREHVKEIAGVLVGKIVVSMANPLRVKDGVVTYLHPPEGSLAEEVQRDAPGSRVVSAFHEISLSRFAKVDEVIDSDTIVCGDDEEAKKVVARLARDLGLRPVDAGPLSNSRYVEAYTTVLISINLRYGSSASLRITGVPE